jgi:hypothetical protein
MTKVTLVQFVVGIFLVSSAFGQKVKYKDIYGLLSTKQYEAAEPFLKKFIKENPDHPNALLYMGITYHEKALKDDVLKQTRNALANMDSAIQFYEKAYKLITDREIKRNSEYYQAYNRRDLRTGEFGVKLSDIQFDLEKKNESLRERIDRVKMVKHYFSLTDSLYKRTQQVYSALQHRFAGEKELFLRADDVVLINLNTLITRYDSCVKAFENYKSSASALGRFGYNQVFTPKPIHNFKTDGAAPADFLQDTPEIWDYKTFATRARQVIEKEIIPTREHLITYDIEINKLREKLKRDSVSVRNDLTKLVDKLLMEQLKKYDDEPLPMDIFSLKISDLEYQSSLLEHKPLRDSANLQLQLTLIHKELQSIARLDSLATKILASDFDKRCEDYGYFITNTYGSIPVLKSFVKTVKDFSLREKNLKLAYRSGYEDALKWIIHGADSVPLFTGQLTSRYKPLAIIEEKYTAGLRFTDSTNAEGYLYSITPSRRPDLKVTFPVDKSSFREKRLNALRNITYADPNNQMFYVLTYSEAPNKDKRYPATLAKIYRTDGLAWSNNFSFTFVPAEIEFKPETGELIVRADTQQIVIDKNGKPLLK